MSTMSGHLTKDDIDFICNILRRGTIKWSGRAECLRRARKRVLISRTKKGKAKFKLMWQCAQCKQWTKDVADMEVDHKVEIGSFTGDWNREVLAVYSPQSNLQALCITCHMKKTKKYNSARSQWQRKK